MKTLAWILGAIYFSFIVLDHVAGAVDHDIQNHVWSATHTLGPAPGHLGPFPGFHFGKDK